MKLTQKPSIKNLFLITVGFLVVSFYNNCGEPFDGTDLASMTTNSTNMENPNSNNMNNNTESKVTITGPMDSYVSELNHTISIPIVIERSSDLINQTIVLKAEYPEIESIDTANGFRASVTPTSLAPNVNMAVLTLSIGTKAPSLMEHIHLEAWVGTLVKGELKVDLAIQPIFRIQVTGDGRGDEDWKSNGRSLNALFTPGTRDIPFVHHSAPGLQVIFENLSTTNTLAVHSSNAIAHSDSNNPVPKSADGITPGGNYSPSPIIGTTQMNAPVYNHFSENSTAARNLLFNVDL